MSTAEDFANTHIDLDATIRREDRVKKFLSNVFESLEEIQDQMAPGEYDFFEQMQKRFEQYGIKMFMSDAQGQWLRRLLNKYCPEKEFK